MTADGIQTTTEAAQTNPTSDSDDAKRLLQKHVDETLKLKGDYLLALDEKRGEPKLYSNNNPSVPIMCKFTCVESGKVKVLCPYCEELKNEGPLRRCIAFHLKENHKPNCLLIAPGTGRKPFPVAVPLGFAFRRQVVGSICLDAGASANQAQKRLREEETRKARVPQKKVRPGLVPWLNRNMLTGEVMAVPQKKTKPVEEDLRDVGADAGTSAGTSAAAGGPATAERPRPQKRVRKEPTAQPTSSLQGMAVGAAAGLVEPPHKQMREELVAVAQPELGALPRAKRNWTDEEMAQARKRVIESRRIAPENEGFRQQWKLAGGDTEAQLKVLTNNATFLRENIRQEAEWYAAVGEVHNIKYQSLLDGILSCPHYQALDVDVKLGALKFACRLSYLYLHREELAESEQDVFQGGLPLMTAFHIHAHTKLGANGIIEKDKEGMNKAIEHMYEYTEYVWKIAVGAGKEHELAR